MVELCLTSIQAKKSVAQSLVILKAILGKKKKKTF